MSTGAVQTQHSYTSSAAAPKGVQSQDRTHYDLPELKRKAGLQPFSKRIKIDSDGYSACPFHHGDSDKSFHIVEKEDGTVIGTCFSECSRSWDAIDFVKKFDTVTTGEAIRRIAATISSESPNSSSDLRVSPQRERAVPMNPQQWEKLGRAVSDADVEKLTASRPHSATPAASTLNKMGFRIGLRNQNAFLIAPYRLGNHFYTLKARSLTSKEFFQENAVSQQGLFNIDAVQPGCDVYIVESELDAAVLYEHGYVAVSVINAKQKSFEAEVLKKLLMARQIFLVGDQDTAGQICMDTLAKLLPAEKIHRITFSDAKDVGEWALFNKKNESLVGNFKENWEILKTDALASWVTHNIPFVSEIPQDSQKWVIHEFLPMNGLTIISARYGGFKSLGALALAQALEQGGEIWGRKISAPTKVLYVDRENPRQAVNERRKGLWIPDNQIRYWGDWIAEQATPNLDDPRLIEFAVKERGVIIIDSLCDFLDGTNENDASDMAALTNKLRRLARLGSGVIVLHHNDKHRGNFRGSTAIVAAADMAIKTTKSETDNIWSLRPEKFRMCGDWEMDVQFHFVDGKITHHLMTDQMPAQRVQKELIQETDAGIEAVVTVVERYQEAREDVAMPQAELLDALAQEYKLSKRHKARKAVEDAVSRGRLEKVPALAYRNAKSYCYRVAEMDSKS